MEPPNALPLQYPVLSSLIWIVILLVVFIPMAINRYKKAVSR
jgi:ABC-2 type transport system permease protein